MTNPIDDYLSLRKEATEQLVLPGMKGMLGSFRGDLLEGAKKGITESAGRAAGAGAVGLLASGLGIAALKTYRAYRKRDDFKSMMSTNPDLAEDQERDPARFNAHYNSMRTLMPHYAEDPIIAGSLMRQMGANPMHAGGLLMQALEGRSKMAPSVKADFGPVEVGSKLF